ncbi:MAG: hypothetical protein ACU88J_07975 [Gammaproteobacteria bacterium]
METNAFHRHQLIKSLTVQEAEKVVDNKIKLWEQLAARIISIVGESGFNALYERSVILTQSTFPWLAASLPLSLADHRFSELKMSLEGQMPEQAGEANCLLLITLTDILASLIGEELTSGILRSAWGNSAADTADMGFKND